jgi:hypothetical protein
MKLKIVQELEGKWESRGDTFWMNIGPYHAHLSYNQNLSAWSWSLTIDSAQPIAIGLFYDHGPVDAMELVDMFLENYVRKQSETLSSRSETASD